MKGRPKQEYYTSSERASKQIYYSALPEKMKRHYLGQEYLSLGSGSKSYLAGVFSCSRQTIQKGYEEVIAPDFKPDYNRQRKSGGGRKKKRGNTKI